MRTFHSISRSKTVASILNDTDPDGKTKIVTKLRVKLPYRNIADIMEVKVDNGAEVNILPLHTFRSMFPHKLDDDGYPTDGFLKGSKTTPQCYDDGKLVNHGTITLRLKHYAKNSFQDHLVLCCRNSDLERDHHWTPSECKARSHTGTM